MRAVTHFDNFMDELTGLKAWHPLRRPPFHDSSLVYIFRGFSRHPWIFKKKKKFRFSRVPLFSLMLLELRTFKLKWIHMIFIHVRNGKNIYNWSCFSFNSKGSKSKTIARTRFTVISEKLSKFLSRELAQFYIYNRINKS